MIMSVIREGNRATSASPFKSVFVPLYEAIVIGEERGARDRIPWYQVGNLETAPRMGKLRRDKV